MSDLSTFLKRVTECSTVSREHVRNLTLTSCHFLKSENFSWGFQKQSSVTGYPPCVSHQTVLCRTSFREEYYLVPLLKIDFHEIVKPWYLLLWINGEELSDSSTEVNPHSLSVSLFSENGVPWMLNGRERSMLRGITRQWKLHCRQNHVVRSAIFPCKHKHIDIAVKADLAPPRVPWMCALCNVL